jgi:tetratricopeptide (TPR) repeat protein
MSLDMPTRRTTIEPFRWVRLAPLHHQRTGAVATVLPDGRVRVQGGKYTDYANHNRQVTPPDEIWDPRTRAWSLSGKTKPDPRHKPDGSLAPTWTPLGDGRILITGGKGESYNAGPFEIDPEPEGDAFVIEKGSQARIPAGRLCVPRWAHATVVLPDGSVMLIGGANKMGAAIADVELGLPPAAVVDKNLKVQLDRNAVKALIDQAGRARGLKRFDDALKFAREAVARAPRNKDAWQELGCVYSAMGRHEEALVEFKRLLAKDGQSPFVWHFIAYTHLQLNRRREALDAYVKVVERVAAEGEDFTTERIHQDARKQRQVLTLELDGPEAALKITGPAEDLSTEEWNNTGVALHQKGRNEEALPCFDRALRIDPKNHHALHNKAAALLQLKRPAEARAALEKAVVLRGDRASGSLINLGVAHYDLGDFDASVKSYDRALKQKPEGVLRVNAWTNRGNSLTKLKKYDLADESYDNALKADPTFATAWHGKVCVAAARARFADVRAALKKLLQLAPGMEAELRADKELAEYWAGEASGIKHRA